MIGLSLSGCVLDILNGNVEIKDVEKIITACNPSHTGLHVLIIDIYFPLYWSKYTKDRVFAILEQIKLEHPRTIKNDHYPMVGGGRWVESEDQIVWSDAKEESHA